MLYQSPKLSDKFSRVGGEGDEEADEEECVKDSDEASKAEGALWTRKE